jgi:chromosome segregation ATPase
MRQSQYAPFGPIVLARRPAHDRHELPGSQQHFKLTASPLEVQSLDNEVKRLLAYVDVLVKRHDNVLEEKDAEHRREIELLRHEHESATQQRKYEFERSSSAQQNELLQLRARLEKLENSERTIEKLSNKVEDYKRKAEEQEVVWANLLTTKEHQWSERSQLQENDISSLNERVELLVQSVEALQATLRQTASEKATMEEYIDSEPQRWNDSTRELQIQLSSQQSVIEDLRRKNKSLETLLDDLQASGAVHDAATDERVALMKHELEVEKRKSADMVTMYCGQVQNLHSQLESAMYKNRQLLDELQREKVVHVQ